MLRQGVASTIDLIWSNEGTGHVDEKTIRSRAGFETLQDKLRQLSPQNDSQRWLQSRALQISSEIAAVRWFLIEQKGHSSLPKPLLVLLVSWLVLIFFIFGLLSPRNETAIVVLIVCALSASASLYMLLELDNPLGGVISVSSEPLRNALMYLGQ
jgi:Flp pilus assembly protein TadB